MVRQPSERYFLQSRPVESLSTTSTELAESTIIPASSTPSQVPSTSLSLPSSRMPSRRSLAPSSARRAGLPPLLRLCLSVLLPLPVRALSASIPSAGAEKPLPSANLAAPR